MTGIETRRHDDGTVDVKIGKDTVLAFNADHATVIEKAARLAYRAGRADEAAIRSAALAGLMAGSPLA